MKRKTLVTIHLLATGIAVLTISTFFISSLVVEVIGEGSMIKEVKKAIFFSLPILLLAMPALGITGNKLASHSKSPTVLVKKKRMKFIIFNGLTLTALACVLYYRSNFLAIDGLFYGLQLAEFGFGFINLILIGLNVKSGLQLSGRLQNGKTSLVPDSSG